MASRDCFVAAAGKLLPVITKGANDLGHTAKRFLCRRTGRYVSAENPVCQLPDKACKYRIDCIIYALQEDERVTTQKQVEEIGRGQRTDRKRNRHPGREDRKT